MSLRIVALGSQALVILENNRLVAEPREYEPK